MSSRSLRRGAGQVRTEAGAIAFPGPQKASAKPAKAKAAINLLRAILPSPPFPARAARMSVA
jgi:hypothetical protein